jgi:2-dehydropantoate 2-reductase
LTPPLVVLGPGAVGGLLTALLARSGQPVTAVARPSTARLLWTSGLEVKSQAFGTWTSYPQVQEEVPAGAAVVLSTKAFALPWAIELLQSARPSEVLTVLNGLSHVEALRSALPGVHVIPATLTGEAGRLSPTQVEHRSPFLRLAVPDLDREAVTVRALRAADVEIAAGGEETEVLWRKFRFLIPLALLTSRHRTSLGGALSRDPDLTEAVIAEVAETATAAGLPTTPSELATILRGLPPTMRSSLEQDLSAGRPHELTALGEDLLSAASAWDVAVPTCADLILSRVAADNR